VFVKISICVERKFPKKLEEELKKKENWIFPEVFPAAEGNRLKQFTSNFTRVKSTNFISFT
jgi:hypothetical protein